MLGLSHEQAQEKAQDVARTLERKTAVPRHEGETLTDSHHQGLDTDDSFARLQCKLERLHEDFLEASQIFDEPWVHLYRRLKLLLADLEAGKTLNMAQFDFYGHLISALEPSRGSEEEKLLSLFKETLAEVEVEKRVRREDGAQGCAHTS